MKMKHRFLLLPAVLALAALFGACAPVSSLRLVLSQDADVKAELERFIAFNRLEAAARKSRTGEWEIVFTRELPGEPAEPFIALRDFIDFTDPADPPIMTLEITEKNPDVVKVLGIDDVARALVFTLDTDRGAFSRYQYKAMGEAMEDTCWDVPLDKDVPELRYASTMRAGNAGAFTDEAARQKFNELMEKLSDIPQTAGHTLAFGPARLSPKLGDLHDEFNDKRTVSFTFDTRALDNPFSPVGRDEQDQAADADTLGEKASREFRLVILFPKLATYLESYDFKKR